MFTGHIFPGITIGGNRIYIGIDAHKLSESVCVTDKVGTILEEYKMDNSEENWNKFMKKYSKDDAEIAVESSTSGKYVAHLLRDNGFHLHLANPKELKPVFKSNKKTDKNDARILARLLRTGDLPESYLPTKEVDELRTAVRYRRSLGEEITSIKNKVHALLAIHGISIEASDIFGKRSLGKILASSDGLPETDSIILTDLISRFSDLSLRIEKMQDKLASMGNGIEEVKTLMTIPGIDYYSAIAIYSEIGDIKRFPDTDHLSSYAGLVPRVDQSGETAIYGHITKSGPSVLRYFIVNSVHTLIKLSPTFKRVYRKMKKRIGRNRSIIAVARKLAIVIYNMLEKKKGFVEEHAFKTLKEKKLKNMAARSAISHGFSREDMENVIKDIGIHSKSTRLLS
ncbi:MAG: IS110 family transposase [Candidatus Thermoplasmatota archaeon]|nr:IS110 family transposase [Candidatus Thermoplasmatota archaeon]